MSLILTIAVYISSILFSLSQAILIHSFKKNQMEGKIFTSCFSIISCLIYEIIWFINYFKDEEAKYIRWCYFSGSCISFLWIIIYFIYYSKTNKQYQIWFSFLYIITMADVIFEICFIENDLLNNNKDKTVKIAACIFNVLMYINPGLDTYKLFTELSKEYFSLPISIIGLFNSCVWLLFGCLSDNDNASYYIYSNIFGIIICLIQIIILFLKKNENIDTIISEDPLIADNKPNKKKGKKSGEKQKTNEEDIIDII